MCGNDDDSGDEKTAGDGKTIAFKSLKNNSLKKRKMRRMYECVSVYVRWKIEIIVENRSLPFVADLRANLIEYDVYNGIWR